VTVEVDPANSQRYLVGDSSEAFAMRTETIDVHGGPAVALEVKSTRWGPIVANDSQGRPLALAWTAHDPRASNVRMVDLELAGNVPEAIAVANRAGIPVQNFVVADREGHIGWTIMGQVPVRANYDSTLPASWRTSGTGWVGWRSPEEYPRLIDPAAGRLWTANTRTIDAESWLAFLGDGGYDLGARAAQIRDNLLALSDATEADLARIQVDDRALFLARWRDLLLELLDDLAIENRAARNNARQLVQKWSGRAAADDAGYAIVRAFRLQVRADVFDTLTARARMKYPASQFAPSAQFEGALWQLVTQRPRHLVDPRYQTWEESLLASLDSALQVLRKDCDELQRCSWGQRNLLDVRHPLSAALPFASHWLDMPAVPMAGDAAMPRVQGPRFGASERLVVSPGHEAEGLFQMPGGPVGHPLSPFYGAGHEAWVNGQPQPLLPGTPEHTLHLTP
ncbi:MAG TPA: penicillin acylase family protein, partial [Povalibacter sp.]